MKKTLLSAMAIALLLGAKASAQDEMKPLIVVSLANYQEMIDDLDFVGQVSGTPDMGKGLEGLLSLVTQGQGLVGLDKKKPWGLAASTDGVSFQLLGFLPIKELDKFVAAIGGVAGEPEDVGDGTWKVELQGQSLYLKQAGDWTFASLGTEFLQDLPKDPVKLLGGLETKYDVAVQVSIQNIPEIFRQLAIEQVKIGLEQGFEGGGLPGLDAIPGASALPDLSALPQLDEKQQELARELAKQQMDSIAELLEDTDQITVGFKIDRESGKTLADLIMTVVPESKAASGLAKMSEGKTNFGGFIVKDAAASLNVNLTLSQDDIAGAKEAVGTLRDQLKNLVKERIPGGDEVHEVVNGFVDKIVDISEKTVESGKIDAGVALVGKGPYVLVAGGAVADAKAVTKVVDEFVETLETQVGFYGFEKNVATHKGVTFHRASVPPLPGEEGEALAKLLGDDIDLVVGIAEKRAYLAMGKDALEQIKQAIDRSEAEASKTVPPVQFTGSLAALIKLMPQGDEADPTMSTMASSLEGVKDRVDVTVKPRENGVEIHFEGEEGILKVIGTMATQMGAALPQF